MHSTSEGASFISSLVISNRKEKKKKERIKDKEVRESLKSIDKLKAEAKVPFQKLIRIRDRGQNCICCPSEPLPYNIGEYDAGHLFKAEI